jgi:hypothetical protein
VAAVARVAQRRSERRADAHRGAQSPSVCARTHLEVAPPTVPMTVAASDQKAQNASKL